MKHQNVGECIPEYDENIEGANANQMAFRCSPELFGVSDIWNTFGSPVTSPNPTPRNSCHTPTASDASYASFSSSQNEWRFFQKANTSSSKSSILGNESTLSYLRSDYSYVSPSNSNRLNGSTGIDPALQEATRLMSFSSHSLMKADTQSGFTVSNSDSKLSNANSIFQPIIHAKTGTLAPENPSTENSTNTGTPVCEQKNPVENSNPTTTSETQSSQEIVENEKGSDSNTQNGVEKDALCRHFLLGRCNRRRCRFRHVSSTGALPFSAKEHAKQSPTRMNTRIESEVYPSTLAYSNIESSQMKTLPHIQYSVPVLQQYIKAPQPCNFHPGMNHNPPSNINFAAMHYGQNAHVAPYSFIINGGPFAQKVITNDVPVHMLVASQLPVSQNMFAGHTVLHNPVLPFMC